jgi:hypothetical protein
MPTRENQTTITVSKKLKRKLDELRGETTYDRFFEELLRVFSSETREWLDMLRCPGENYWEVLARILPPRRRDQGELKGFLELAALNRRAGKVRVIKKGKAREIIIKPWVR